MDRMEGKKKDQQGPGWVRLLRVGTSDQIINILGFYEPYGLHCNRSALPWQCESIFKQRRVNESGCVPVDFIYGHRNLNFMQFSHVKKDDASFESVQPFKNVNTSLSLARELCENRQ